MCSPTPHRSGSWMRPALLCLSLFVLVAGAAASCQSYTAVTPAPQTWSTVYGSAATVTGPIFVTVPVVYDLPAQHVVGGVFINVTGAIYVEDRGAGQSASLTTDFISVQGLLQVGAANCPLLSVFTFDMLGDAEMPYVVHPSDTPMLKAIVVWSGGSLELHGAKGLTAPNGVGVSWTRLEGSLNAGATVATLADNVHTNSINDWQVGDRIIVTTTDYVSEQSYHSDASHLMPQLVCNNRADMLSLVLAATRCFGCSQDPYQTEEVVITGFPSANQISFSPALGIRPLRCLDLRQRPARLHRPPHSQHHSHHHRRTLAWHVRPGRLTGHAGHAYYAHVGFVACHAEGLNIQYGGQGDFQARYPWHWHLAGAVAAGTYFRASSIENSLVPRCDHPRHPVRRRAGRGGVQHLGPLLVPRGRC